MALLPLGIDSLKEDVLLRYGEAERGILSSGVPVCILIYNVHACG